MCSQQPRWPCSSPSTTCPRSGVSAPYAMDGCANGMNGFYLTVVSGLISMSATVPPPSDSYAPTHRHVKADTPKLFREYNVQSMMYGVCRVHQPDWWVNALSCCLRSTLAAQSAALGSRQQFAAPDT